MRNKYLSAVLIAAILVSACGGGGETTPTPPTLPAAPTGLTIAAGDLNVTPSWTPASGATSYNAYYRTSAGVTIANSTKVTGAISGSPITGLTNGTQYFVAVTAVNADGESALSSEASATPVAPSVAPSVPTGMSIVAGDAQATLTWPSVSGASSYNIYYQTTAGVTIASGTKIANATSGTAVTGLTNGTTYYFVLTAVNSFGESGVSSEVSVTPQVPVAAPVAPTVTSFAPSSAAVGASVAVVGTNFSAVAANNTVKFNGVSATVTSATSTQLIVTVPASAISGTISVATAGGTATSIGSFAVTRLMGGAIQGNSLNLAGTVTIIAGVTGVNGAGGFADGNGAAAQFNEPRDITTDGVNLYVADKFNHSIRKIVIATGAVTTIAGSGVPGSVDGFGSAAQFNTPKSITNDGTNLYVADSGNSTIRKVVIATGEVTTLAGSAGLPGSTDGFGMAARFDGLNGITTDGVNLYVADAWTHIIRKVVIASGEVTTIAGSAGVFGSADGLGAAARFNSPIGVTTDGTNLYVGDLLNHTIRKIVIATGQVSTIAGSVGVVGATNGTGAAALFNSPGEIVTDGTSLYVADEGSATIRKVVIATGAVTTISGIFGDVRGMTTDGTSLYAVDMKLTHLIKKVQ